jgi:hypothetical protein
VPAASLRECSTCTSVDTDFEEALKVVDDPSLDEFVPPTLEENGIDAVVVFTNDADLMFASDTLERRAKPVLALSRCFRTSAA